MNDTNKTLSYYMGLPYFIMLHHDRDDPEAGWFFRIRELPGCMSHGATQWEALENIKEAMELWIETALENGDPIPEPQQAPSQEGWEENRREAASAHIPLSE